MGSSSGKKKQKQAGQGGAAGDSTPLDGQTNCQPPEAKLAVVVQRCDKPTIKVGGVAVEAAKPPKLTATSASNSGLADFGTVQPGSYTITTALTEALRKKFLPAEQSVAVVTAGQSVLHPICLPPVVRLKILLFDRQDKTVSGADWAVKAGVEEKGKTGADGLLDIEIPWTAAAGEVTFDLPAEADAFVADAPPEPAAAVVGAVPPYPLLIRHVQFPKPEPKAKRPAAKLHFTVDIGDIEDGETTDGAAARLHNLGFRWSKPEDQGRSVKAYQRWYANAKWAGSGAIGDIRADLKKRHDDV